MQIRVTRRTCFCFIVVALVCVQCVLSGCTRHDQTYRTTGHVFGTVVEINIYGPSQENADELSAEVLNEFDRLHRKLHAWQPSMLTALNDSIARGEPFQADAEMVDLLQSATALSEHSDNLFNPAIGHLIRLWGFQASDITPHDPNPDEIRRWVEANPRLSDLRYNGTIISSTNKAVMIDLGGYAKGYALDRAALILRQAHVKAALINIGGNILAIGQPGERPWKVGIRDPRHQGTLTSLELHDNEAIGTSGDDQRYFMNKGKRHPHIIDPHSGETIDLVASVTILISGGKDVGLRSDGNSKPLFISGPEHWRDMAQRLGLRDVLLVAANGQIEMTPDLQARLATDVN